jgi:hypothetical protein
MISPPGTRVSTSAANSISWRSGKMISPSLVTTPRRSPSPSKARPISASVSLQRADHVGQVFRLGRVGWWLGKLPSTSQNSSSLRSPGGLNSSAPCAGHAVAAVDDDLHRARELHVADDAVDVGGQHVGVGALALAGMDQVALGDALRRRPGSCSPNSVCPPSTIFRPL